MKVVFLDFDGVLNSGLYFNKRLKSVEEERIALIDDNNHFDPEAVALLNEITDRTGAVIVVSSSWRYGRSLLELRELLSGVGVTGYVTDKTPTMGGVERGDEIAHWLNRPTVPVKSYVVLDDNGIGESWSVNAHFVKTEYATGLTREHVERAVSMLGESKAA